MSRIKMAPCPWCGRRGEWKAIGHTDMGDRYVYCPNCYATGPNADSNTEARQLWNEGRIGSKP